jgi:hypothetical protein
LKTSDSGVLFKNHYLTIRLFKRVAWTGGGNYYVSKRHIWLDGYFF